MKKLFFSFVITSFFYMHLLQASESSIKIPMLKINSVSNHTSYDLELIDRIHNKKLMIPSKTTITLAYIVKNYKNIAIYGSMKDCMQSSAQFVLHPTNNADTQDYYINFSLIPGGINDGSGFILGVPGTLNSKFYMAGSKIGCTMRSSQLKNSDADEVEISLILVPNKNSLIEAECTFSTDTKN